MVGRGIGDVLTLGPLDLYVSPPTAAGDRQPAGSHHHHHHHQCWLNVRVRFGYLVASSSTQGALNLTCSGACRCRGLKSEWQRRTLPFPWLETGRLSPAVSDQDEHVAMSAYTTFIAEHNPVAGGGSGCYVRVRHETSATAPAYARHVSNRLMRDGAAASATEVGTRVGGRMASRVRVDSLALIGPHGGPHTGKRACTAGGARLQ